MQPGEPAERQPLPLIGRAGLQHMPAKVREIVPRERHATHVGVEGEPCQAEFVLLGVIRAPGHRINRPNPGHPGLHQRGNPGLKQQRHLGSHRERVAGCCHDGITGQQLVEIRGATAPMANDHDRIIRQLHPPQALGIQKRLQPGQRLHQESAEADQQAHPPMGERGTAVLQPPPENRWANEARGYQSINHQLSPCHGFKRSGHQNA